MKKIVVILLILQLLLFSFCKKTIEDDFDRIAIQELDDFIPLHKSIQLKVIGISGGDTSLIPNAVWINSDKEMYSLAGDQLIPSQVGMAKITCHYNDLSDEKVFEIRKTEFKIKNLLPPSEYYVISEGSCGEATLWTICQYFGKNFSQEEINKIGGDPKRGLHGNEVIKVLDSLKISYNIKRKADTWESTVDTLKNIIMNGDPIILGVKIYPDMYPSWAVDHFILLTGLDIKDNIFYCNSFTTTKQISISKLLNTQNGYSLINTHDAIYAVEIALPH